MKSFPLLWIAFLFLGPFRCFKIKPLPGYEIGDSISNTAYIYFDFNPAIVTNTFTSTFMEALSVNHNQLSAMKLFPNPTSAFVEIAFAENQKVKEIVLRDISGKIVLSGNSAFRNRQSG